MPNWIAVCPTDEIEEEDVMRWDHGGATFAIFRAPDGSFHATDGLCSHEAAHLAGGLVIGDLIECPKHQGLFDYRTGAAKQAPACAALRIWPVKVDGDLVFIDLG